MSHLRTYACVYVQLSMCDLQLVPSSVNNSSVHIHVENSMSNFLHAVAQLLCYSPRRIQSLVSFSHSSFCPPVRPAKLFSQAARLFMYCAYNSTTNYEYTCLYMHELVSMLMPVKNLHCWSTRAWTLLVC